MGTVTDTSGSAVPNASVSVVSTDRNLAIRTIKSDDSGSFVATFLPIGVYSVKVEAQGFKVFRQENIRLNVNDKYTISAALEVGDVTQQVTVEAGAVQVDLQSSANSTLINGEQVRELQLNNRNFIQLLSLMPGVVSNSNTDTFFIGTSAPGGTTNTIPFSINGARSSQNNWTVDGADIVDRGSNLTLLNYPSVDAIAEFRVLRGQYSAEFGRAASGQVNVITRSGTSKYHGSAYEFFRHDKLSANNFLNNANGTPRPPLRYNNFGFTLSGPVAIPHLYNPSTKKTFFFWSEEYRRQSVSSTIRATAPTAPWLNGTFTTPVCTAFNTDNTCAATGTQITNISPTARAYIKDIFSKLPLSQTSTAISTVFQPSYKYRQDLIKIDHVFSERLSLSARFINDNVPTIDPGGLFTALAYPGVATTDTNAPGKGWVVRATSSLSSTWFNELGYAWTKGGIFSTPTGTISSALSPDIQPKLLYPKVVERVPSLNFSSLLSTITGYGPYDNTSQNHNIFDNMTKILGRHTVKFGTSINFYQKRENQVSNNTGTFTFTSTGVPAGTSTAAQTWANFLLGRAATFSQAPVDIFPDLRSSQYEFYVQDDVRLRPNLTVNIGLRYGLYRQPTEKDNVLTNFDPRAYDPTKAPQVSPTTGNIILGTGNLENGIIVAGKNSPYGRNIANQDNSDFAPRIGIVWDPFGNGKTAIRSGYGLAYDVPLLGIYQNNIGTDPPFATTVTVNNTSLDDANAGVVAQQTGVRALRATPVPFKTPYVQQWSFDIQRQIAQNLVVQVGYYGSKGTNLIGVLDINALPPGYAVRTGTIPAGTAVTSTNSPRLNAIRPYQGYGAINTIQSRFDSNYNSLQASLQKRFSGRSQIGVAYTWSKAITNAPTDRSSGVVDITNLRLERGEASFSRPHVFTMNYIYELPFYKSGKGFTGIALGGWQLSGIITAQSGLATTVSAPTSRDPAGVGFIGNTAITTPRPDLIGDPNNGPKTVLQFFNTAAFADVPAGEVRLGNAGRGVVRGPGYWKTDLALFKNFTPVEALRIQFRAEAFNALNHTNFSSIGTTLGVSTFGQVTAVRDPRSVQLALKLSF